MRYIESYSIFKILNESLLSDDQRMVNKAFLNMADPETGLCMWDGELIKPKDVVDVINETLNYMQDEWPYWYSYFMDFSIIWSSKSGLQVDTMAVDDNMNLYINPLFVQKYLKNKVEYTQFVLMHEMMHVVFNHVRRSKNYLNNSPIARTWRDTNLAGDLEINTFLVLLNVITRSEIENEIGGGVILDEVNRVITLEDILDSDDLMNKLKSKFDQPNKSLPQQNNNSNNDIQADGGESQQLDPAFVDGFNEAKKIINDMVAKGLSTEEIIAEINKIRK